MSDEMSPRTKTTATAVIVDLQREVSRLKDQRADWEDDLRRMAIERDEARERARYWQDLERQVREELEAVSSCDSCAKLGLPTLRLCDACVDADLAQARAHIARGEPASPEVPKTCERCGRPRFPWGCDFCPEPSEPPVSAPDRGEAPDAIREHVKEGLADSAAGRVSSLGSFAQYAETEAAKALADTGAKCATCGKPAACVGRYEAMEHFEPACDECCGHGCEDGRCYPVATAPPSAPDDAKDKALAALRELTAEFRRFGPRVSLQYEEPTFEATLSESWLARLDEAIAALTTKAGA